MSRVLALVEGQTEETFIRDLLAPAVGMHGIDLRVRLAKGRGHGGVPTWAKFKPILLKLLKEDLSKSVTMMIDFYGMPNDWPGRAESKDLPYPENIELVESGISCEVSDALGEDFNPDRLIPYVQCHEFEALLFSDPKVVGDYLAMPNVAVGMASIVSECGSPEEINDNPNTAPSKRISALIEDYDKIVHGTILAGSIGISTLRAECPHFGEWVSRLEKLAPDTE
ncbi:MAG: DUF4276 family protein [Planctomycetota bacterium]